MKFHVEVYIKPNWCLCYTPQSLNFQVEVYIKNQNNSMLNLIFEIPCKGLYQRELMSFLHYSIFEIPCRGLYHSKMMSFLHYSIFEQPSGDLYQKPK